MLGDSRPGRLIGIDIGTGAVKAVLAGLDGETIATFAQAYPTARPRPGHVEQNPDDWTELVIAALAGFAAAHDLGGVIGIGLTSQVNTHVFVGADGAPLLPAFVWQDSRAASDAAALDARVTPEEKAAWFGGPMPIDASHALARMAHVARVHPSVFEKTRHVLLPKDYVALRLTGEVAADPISAVGLVDASFAYVEGLIARVPGAREKLPPLMPITHRVGTVRSGFPCAGVPVTIGTMDAWASMFGVGVTRNGEAMYLSGTSEVLGVLSDRHDPTAGVIVFPPWQEITFHAAPTQSGGASLGWLSELLGRDVEAISALVADAPLSESVPLFLPHLEGERAPLWDATSRGVFARIDTSAGPGAFARAVMEGVALSARLALEACERSAAYLPEIVNHGGGGARSDVWCRIRADALGKPLRRARHLDSGTLGAAMIAGLGAGAFASLGEAADRLVSFGPVFEPDPANRGYYDARFEKYQQLYRDLKPFNAGYR